MKRREPSERGVVRSAGAAGLDDALGAWGPGPKRPAPSTAVRAPTAENEEQIEDPYENEKEDQGGRLDSPEGTLPEPLHFPVSPPQPASSPAAQSGPQSSAPASTSGTHPSDSDDDGGAGLTERASSLVSWHRVPHFWGHQQASSFGELGRVSLRGPLRAGLAVGRVPRALALASAGCAAASVALGSLLETPWAGVLARGAAALLLAALCAAVGGSGALLPQQTSRRGVLVALAGLVGLAPLGLLTWSWGLPLAVRVGRRLREVGSAPGAPSGLPRLVLAARSAVLAGALWLAVARRRSLMCGLEYVYLHWIYRPLVFDPHVRCVRKINIVTILIDAGGKSGSAFLKPPLLFVPFTSLYFCSTRVDWGDRSST